MEKDYQKTGATPLAVGDLGPGKIVAVNEVKTYVVAFIDGHGEKFVRFVDMLENGDVYVRAEDRTSAPAQRWFKEALKTKLEERANSVSKVLDIEIPPTKADV